MSQDNQKTSAQKWQKNMRVKLGDLHTDCDRFQFRAQEYEEHHVRELIDALKRGDTLDRMLVWRSPEDGCLYILAGHHRLRAYQAMKWRKALRVNLFLGTLKEAKLVALGSNTKTKLPMSAEERVNAAWCLTCHWNPEKGDKGYDYSIKDTKRMAGVSASQVSIMRRTMRTLHERHEKGPEDMPKTWLKARLDLDDEADRRIDDDENEALIEAQAAKWDAKIGSDIMKAGKECPAALARLLARRLGSNLHTVASFCATEETDFDELAELESEESEALPF